MRVGHGIPYQNNRCFWCTLAFLLALALQAVLFSSPAQSQSLDCEKTGYEGCEYSEKEATLTLVKKVVNRRGGKARARDFKLSFTGPANGMGFTGDQSITMVQVPAGNYNLFETPVRGYVLTSLNCEGAKDDKAEDGLDLEAGEKVTCTFTNEDREIKRTGKVIINKVTIGGDGKFDFVSSNQTVGNFTLTTDNNTAMTVINEVEAGTFTVTESDPSVTGFELVDITCTDSNVEGVASTATVANRTATINLGPQETVECTFTNRKRRLTSLTIAKRVIGANKNFTFSGTTPFGSFSLSNGQTTTQSNLLPGTFIITETTDPLYSLNSITCVGNSNAPVIDLAAGTLTIFVEAGDDVTCTFENGQVRDPRMEEETRRFIHRRVDNLLTHRPDRGRLLRRLQERPPQQGSLKDTGPLKHSDAATGQGSMGAAGGGQISTTPGNQTSLFNRSVDAHSNDVRAVIDGVTTTQSRNPFFDAIAGKFAQSGFGQSSFKFATSLSDLRAKAAEHEAQRQKKNLAAAGLNYSGQYGAGPYLQPRTGLDIWVEGQISRYNDGIGGVNREGDFRILYVGADYAMAPGLLIGVLAQIDDTEEDINQTGETGSINGTGWMAGPYIGMRLYKNLLLDVRAAWGRSNNDIHLQDAALGARTGNFDTDRWLVTGTLSGNYTRGPWRFTPQLELAYGHEEYDTYVNSLGLTVLGGEASIGRLSGTLEVGYSWRTPSGFYVEPHAAITGIWNFDSDSLVINNTLFATDESRARIEGGITVTTPRGWSLRAAANYDGIGGDDFESYGGSAWISIPLN